MTNNRFDIYFNNKSALNDIKVKAEKRPNIPTPKKKITAITIPGRDGDLYEDEEAYSDITFTVKFGFLDRIDYYGKLRSIKQWLLNVTDNKMTFSDDPEYFYIVKVVNCDEIERQIKVFGFFEVKFSCDPFQYSYIGQEIIGLTGSTKLVHSGYNSRPYVKVYGSGNITLTINSKAIVLTNVIDYIELDSYIQDCFKGTLNCNNSMTGDFPIFTNGENMISWTGTVTKVEIIPRWRYL